VPPDSGRERRAPNEWDLVFDISNVPLETPVDIEFSVRFWNAFQDPEQWWGGFRISHPTELSLYSIQFPAARRPLPDTLAYYYYVSNWQPYDKELHAALVNDANGRVEKLTWEVLYPRGDRSYRVKWGWSK